MHWDSSFVFYNDIVCFIYKNGEYEPCDPILANQMTDTYVVRCITSTINYDTLSNLLKPIGQSYSQKHPN